MVHRTGRGGRRTQETEYHKVNIAIVRERTGKRNCPFFLPYMPHHLQATFPSNNG